MLVADYSTGAVCNICSTYVPVFLVNMPVFPPHITLFGRYIRIIILPFGICTVHYTKLQERMYILL